MLLILRVAPALVQFDFIDSLVSFANNSGAHCYEFDKAEACKYSDHVAWGGLTECLRNNPCAGIDLPVVGEERWAHFLMLAPDCAPPAQK